VWARAVAEALSRVLLHRPQGVLAVLLALVFVEEAKDLAGHLAGGIIGVCWVIEITRTPARLSRRS
jgi:hypothetical protein